MTGPKIDIIKRADRNVSIPLSYAQQRLWFLWQLDPESPTYNLPAAVRLRGALDIDGLIYALSEILRRHEALRTCFPVIDGTPVQEIKRPIGVKFSIIDLSQKSEKDRELEAKDIHSKEIIKPFDLARGPLFRAKILKMSHQEHLLLVTMHHIIVDGLSIEVILKELAILYKAHCLNIKSPLPELKIQYADYTIWQRERLNGEEIEKLLGYWRKQLKDAPRLDLPIDREGEVTIAAMSARERVAISEATTLELNKLSRREGVTLFMILLAVVQVILARYSEQEDICVGTDVANRNRPELINLIGFFVNQLVLRGNLSGNPSFRHLLGRISQIAVEAYLHQELPFEKLVEEVSPIRSATHSPLFRVKTTLQHRPKVNFEMQGMQISILESTPGAAKNDLEIIFRESGNELEIDLEYSTGLFQPEIIGRFACHLQNILYSVADNPDQVIWDIEILSSNERAQILNECSSNIKEYPKETGLMRMFKAQVESRPNAIAIIFEEQHVSYLELNMRSNRLARYLNARGIGPEQLVGVFMHRSVDSIVSLLAVLKTGAGFAPLDVNSPKARLEYMLLDSDVRVILTHERLKGESANSAVELICLDDDSKIIDAWGCDDSDISVGPENIAYTIYTSGSTGEPKGALGLHKGVINRCYWMWKTYPFEDGEVCCQKTSLGFVDSIWEIFGPLLQGIPIVIIPDSVLKDISEFIKSLIDNRVTRLVLVPSLLDALLDHYQEQLPQTSIRLWISSGERLEPKIICRFAEALPHARLLNLYGSSEVSADVSWEDSISALSAGRQSSIGRSIDNNQLYVMDGRQQLKPRGIWGELYVGGEGLGRGYLRRPDLTGEKFVPHPCSRGPGARLYKTGDISKLRSDGRVDYLGRIDHQVKIRGHRIELGEIEAGLMRIVGVRSAAAIVKDDRRKGKQIIAYVVLEEKGSILMDTLSRRLKENLPSYMVPFVIIELEQFPLTPNGKIDRHALALQRQDRFDAEERFIGPRTPLEKTLALTWSDALGIERISVDKNFFDLGGHSLLATKVMSRIRELCHVDIPLRRLFEKPTIAELSLAVMQAQVEQVDETVLDHLLEDNEFM